MLVRRSENVQEEFRGCLLDVQGMSKKSLEDAG